jgi:hypothetical protein
MISYLWLDIKRFAVLVPGIVIFYLSVRDIFPFFDKRLPFAFAFLATYILGAYVLIPAILRLWRIIVPANHLPLYCITPDGYASDPLNIGIIGSRRQLIKAMTAAGWYKTDRRTLGNLTHAALAILLNRSYPATPVSSLYLFGRKQDISFEKSLTRNHGRGRRHHVRFWATTYEDLNTLSATSIHWYNRRAQPQTTNLLWVGAASQDIGLTFIKHSLQITHRVVPDTDSERELIVRQLETSQLAKTLTTIELFSPYRLTNRAWGGRHGYLSTDGKMTIVRLNFN